MHIVRTLIVVLIFALQSQFAISQTDTGTVTTKGYISLVAGVQWKGISASSAITDVYIFGAYHPPKSTGSMWAFANLQGSTQINGWGYFAIGGSNRFTSKKNPKRYIEMGAGMGLQTGMFLTFRPIIYAQATIPIKKRSLVLFGSGDFQLTFMSLGALQRPIPYRYKFFALYQLSADPDGMNIFAGIHAEYDAAIGPTIQIWSPGGHIQIWTTCGVNLEREDWHTGRRPSFNGAYGLTVRF